MACFPTPSLFDAQFGEGLHNPNFNRFRLIHPCERRTGDSTCI